MSFLETRIPNYIRFYRRTLGRLLGWLFSWRIMRRVLLTVVAVVTLAATYLTEERWRGERAWSAYKQLHHLDQADNSDAAKLPPVPDDQNFAMTPLLKPLYTQGDKYRKKLEASTDLPAPGGEMYISDQDIQKPAYLKTWQKYLGTTDILQALKQIAPTMDEIAAASRRPYARFPSQQENPNFYLDLNWFFQLSQLYQLRTAAALDQKQSAQAAEDIVTQFRLGHAIGHDPTLTSELISEAMASMGTRGLHLGLNNHEWTEDQLTLFQAELQKTDFVATLQNSLQVEQSKVTERIEGILENPDYPDDWWPKKTHEILRMLPRGWVCQSLVNYNDYMDALRAAFDPQQHRVDGAALDALDEQEKKIKQEWWSPYAYLAFHANLSIIAKNSSEQMQQFDFATASCAIERYRLAHGSLPDTLQELVPQYLEKVPADVFHGTPLKYTHEGTDQYTLSYVDSDSKGTTVFGAPVATLIWKYPFN